MRSRYPADPNDWQVVQGLYEAERLAEALDTALELGLGGHTQHLSRFRTLEAEALTAERSLVRPVRANLSLEFVEEELGALADRVAASALDAFEDVARRFGYGHETNVKLTVLASETDAPWLYGRFGYCVEKAGFYKICIPRNLAGEGEELRRTLQHEYAHVIGGTLSNGRCPRWLEEALAMQAEGGVPRSQARLFASGQEEWLGPEDLEADLRDLDDTRDKWLAYMQAGLIGGFMAHREGEASLGRLLRAFGAGTFWPEFWARIRGRSPEEAPIERVYKLRLASLFKLAHEWVRAGR